MSQYLKGAAALGALSGGDSTPVQSSEFTKFSSGTTLKVGVKGTEDVMSYVSYGIFKKVNTFVAKNPSVRNEKGYVESNYTPWDKASQYYYDKARSAQEAGAGEKEVEAIRNEGYKYAGKQRFVLGFYDLATGKDIVVDFTKKQAIEVHAVITKYENRLHKMAFELTKSGARSDTKVSLMPIIDLEEDLTDVERANFDKMGGSEFNAALFDGLLFESDEKTQIENLVAAGFDISLIGLTVGAGAENGDESLEETDAQQYDF